MKKLRLLNTSEYLTEKKLRKVLEGTRFRVCDQLSLYKVIRTEPGERVSKGERTLLASSELDFVIYDDASEPQFAIEFDGPAHQYEDQKRRDLRKNRLCQRAGLSLLRITDTHHSASYKQEEHEHALIRDYELIERLRTAEQTTVTRLHDLQVMFGIQWTLPLEEDFNWREAPIDYAMRTGKFPIAFQEVPGMSMPELVENVCDFLALRQIEVWAIEHLQTTVNAG